MENKQIEEKFRKEFEVEIDADMHITSGKFIDLICDFISSLLSTARQEEGDKFTKLGLLFGIDIYTNTTDTSKIEKIKRYLTLEFSPKVKSDSELEREVFISLQNKE